MDVKKIIEERLGVKVEYTVREKDGEKKAALVVGNGAIRPIIYLEDTYNVTVDNVDDFLKYIEEAINDGENKMEEVRKMITNWEDAKNNLALCVGPQTGVHANESVVKSQIVDLYKYVRVIFGEYSSAVTYDMIKEWGISEEELFGTANNNIDYEIKSMAEMLGFPGMEMGGPYIITSADMAYGASCICCKDILDRACDKLESDRIAIIPSSIHEVIIMPDDLVADGMTDVIKQVNDDIVDDRDILSYSLYMYSKGGEVEIAG